MARARKTRSQPKQQNTETRSQVPTQEVATAPSPTTSNTIQTQTTTTTATQQGENKKMPGLSEEQIAQLLAGSKTKGLYIGYIKEFLNSGENGVNVSETWADLKSKSASTVKQGFENAKNSKNAPDTFKYVRVLKNDEQVYLIKMTELEGGAQLEEAEAA